MGIKLDLNSINLLQWSKEKSYLGSKLANYEYWNVFEWFLHFLAQKLSQLDTYK